MSHGSGGAGVRSLEREHHFPHPTPAILRISNKKLNFAEEPKNLFDFLNFRTGCYLNLEDKTDFMSVHKIQDEFEVCRNNQLIL